jgi:hypothetical protein
MGHGGPVFRPRDDTRQWAAACTAGFALLAIATRDATYLFPGAMCFAVLLQCAQHIDVDGRFVQRIGLRPTMLDLGTAEIVQTGSAWWRELFFCGPMLQLRDADGHRLYLESWLWPPEARASFVEAIAGNAHT